MELTGVQQPGHVEQTVWGKPDPRPHPGSWTSQFQLGPANLQLD